nr:MULTISPECIES: substrate-binding domain-containing protein [unclassified Leifsonia]
MIVAGCIPDSFERALPEADRLISDPGLTAIVAGSDIVAMAVITAARGRGLRVPEDLSVVGFDGSRLAQECHPHSPASTFQSVAWWRTRSTD